MLTGMISESCPPCRGIRKKKNIRAFNRRWYEYLWPRDAKIMLGKTRILSPTLIRSVRFVLDDTGYLSDHACLMIKPRKKSSRAWEDFRKAVEASLGKPASDKELLQYCLAFLNSGYAQERLVTGHRPTPKGSYAITEAYLREIPIALPHGKRTAKKIIELVAELQGDAGKGETRRSVPTIESELEFLVQEALDRPAR